MTSCINTFVHCKKYCSYAVLWLIGHVLRHCLSVLQDVSSQTGGIFGCRLFHIAATSQIYSELFQFLSGSDCRRGLKQSQPGWCISSGLQHWSALQGVGRTRLVCIPHPRVSTHLPSISQRTCPYSVGGLAGSEVSFRPHPGLVALSHRCVCNHCTVRTRSQPSSVAREVGATPAGSCSRGGSAHS